MGGTWAGQRAGGAGQLEHGTWARAPSPPQHSTLALPYSVASPGVSPFPGVELQRATELGDEAHPNVNQEAYGQLFPHATLV